MRLKTTKSAQDIKLSDISVELEIVDKHILSITLTDDRGRFVRVAKGDQYSSNISVQVPEPEETEDKWVVKATLHKGSDSEILFRKAIDDEHRANMLKSDLENKGAEDATVEKVAVLKERTDASTPRCFTNQLDDIPF